MRRPNIRDTKSFRVQLNGPVSTRPAWTGRHVLKNIHPVAIFLTFPDMTDIGDIGDIGVGQTLWSQIFRRTNFVAPRVPRSC